MLTQNPDSSQATDWSIQSAFFSAPWVSLSTRWSAVSVGMFFVSVPVFFQAPLVRLWPWIGLASTVFWLLLGYGLLSYWRKPIWGDLIFGFTWSWFAGAIYWGWLREEPLLHLPIEAIGLPFALFALWRGSVWVGHCFYLGSLLGTAITDLYFYALDLIPDWRRVMRVTLDDSWPILHEAGEKVRTFGGFSWALLFVVFLLLAASIAIASSKQHWWVFGGAVLGTLLVDALFGLSAFV